jgi:fatty-acyl-CoA synthase
MSLFPGTLLDALAVIPDRTAFEHGSRRVSAGELVAMTRRIAAGLRHAGLGRRSRVAMMVSLSPDGFAAHLAAFALGCTVVCVRPGWTAQQLTGVLGGGRVDAVVVDSATGTPEVLTSAGRTRLLTISPSDQHAQAHDDVGRPDLADLLSVPDDGRPLTIGARPHDIARVNFTSGSSGRPKGCMWTYAALHPMFDPDLWPPQLKRLIAGFERCLVFGSWAMPVMLTFAGRSLLVGGTVVIGAHDARQILADEVQRHRITGTVTPVPALHRMLTSLRRRPADLSCLRALVVTGSPATPDLLVAATEHLGPVLWQGYGQSESGMIALLTPDDLAPSSTASTSVGRLLPQVELSVRDPESGRPVPAGAIGQIWVRHGQMMAGYWGDDARETAEVLRDGWLDTRDLGRLDGDGFLHLTGRARDVILVNASIRYAAPVERVLAAHPDIDQAYVVGAPDERTGEAVHAFVVAAAGRSPDLDALSASVRAELGEDSVPATITILTDVPLLAGGKPDKAALRTLAARHRGRQRPPSDNEPSGGG